MYYFILDYSHGFTRSSQCTINNIRTTQNTSVTGTWCYNFSHYKNKLSIFNDTQSTHRRHFGFISNFHIRWIFCLKIIGKISLWSCPSPCWSFNISAYSQFNQHGTIYLSLIKITSKSAFSALDMRQWAKRWTDIDMIVSQCG